MSAPEITSPAQTVTTELLLEAQADLLAAAFPKGASPKDSKSLVVENADATLPYPPDYKARINNLLAHLLSKQANAEAKAGERHTLETIERVKSDLAHQAATHPKIAPLVEILIRSLPEAPVSIQPIVSERPVQA